MQQPAINYEGSSLGRAVVLGANVTCLEILASQRRFHFWNICDHDGNTPLMLAVMMDDMKMVEILARCPRVDLDFVCASGKYVEDFARYSNKCAVKQFMYKSPGRRTGQRYLLFCGPLLLSSGG